MAEDRLTIKELVSELILELIVFQPEELQKKIIKKIKSKKFKKYYRQYRKDLSECLDDELKAVTIIKLTPDLEQLKMIDIIKNSLKKKYD